MGFLSRLFTSLRSFIHAEKARQAERKLDARIESQRISQVRDDAGVDELTERVAEAESLMVTRPELERLERARIEARAVAQERARVEADSLDRQ